MTDPPNFVIAPKNLTVTTGSTLSLPCQVTGYPTPTVEWLRPGGKIPIGRTTVTSQHTMIVTKVAASDSGHYACIAESDAGSIRADVHVDVLAVPYFKEKPSDQVVKVGTTQKLPCSLGGEPNPIVLWRLPGEDPSNTLLANSRNGHKKVEDDGSLSVENIQMKDSGLYTCFGTNSGGGVVARAKILTVEAFPPPIVGIAPTDKIISDGDTINLSCEPASEAAEPSVTWWFRPASHLPEYQLHNNDSTKLVLSEYDVLTIKNVTRSNSGIYTCRIKAETGSDEATAVVRYEENAARNRNIKKNVPAPPSKPRVKVLNNTSVRLSWQPNSNQMNTNYPTTYMIEFWRQGWTEWRIASLNVDSNIAIISDLSESYTYTFLVRSIFDNEQSFPSPWSNPVRLQSTNSNMPNARIRFQAERKLDKPIVALKSVSARSSRSVYLSWEEIDDNSDIDGTLLYWISHSMNHYEEQTNVSKVHVATVFGSSSSHLVQGLEPYTLYTFFLVPFWKKMEGIPSNSISLTTPEDGECFNNLKLCSTSRECNNNEYK